MTLLIFIACMVWGLGTVALFWLGFEIGRSFEKTLSDKK